jgi:hypothetical protein
VSVGAKTGLLAYAAQDIAQTLRAHPVELGGDCAEALLRRIYPDWRVDRLENAELIDDLWEAVYPPEDVAYATCFPTLEIVCDRNVMVDHPSRLPQRYLDAALGRTVVLHAMHSGTDWLAFAVWKDGVLVRSLSLSPHGGILEDIGERLPFEAPYWAGERPVTPVPGWPSKGPYPLPFHPLALGEAALRALFGFAIEGRREPGDVDASALPVHAFNLTDPDSPTLEERRAQRTALIARMGPPRSMFLQPDGSWTEAAPSPEGSGAA